MENNGICVVCGNEYKVYHKSRQKYCSTNCRVKGNKDEKKQVFNFLEKEYKKPKTETQIIRTKNEPWLILSQRLKKHEVLKSKLVSKKKEIGIELYKLTSQNKEKIIASFIGLGIGVLGGYILATYLKKPNKGQNKDLIKKTLVDIPIGVLIGGLGLLGAFIGYGVGAAVTSIEGLKNKSLLKKISDLNLAVTQIDGDLRLESMNISEIEAQMSSTPEYSSVIEHTNKIVVL
jgi:hypothetical protein